MKHALPGVLEECLQKLQAGDDLESILMEYPESAVELRSFLVSAQAAHLLDRPTPVPARAQSCSRDQFLQAAQQSQHRQMAWSNRLVLRKIEIALVTVLLFIILGSTGSMTTAHALPGEPLFSFKLASE